MNNRKLFQIGDVAKMFHLSVGTLRHYEQVGLLSPEYTDPDSGYRYYSVRQFEMLTTIRYLRALDMSLPDIQEFLKNRDTDVIVDKLRAQQRIIETKQAELSIINRKLENRIKQIENAGNSEIDKIEIVRLPAFRDVIVRDLVRWNSYLFLEPSIRQIELDQDVPVSFLGKVGVGVSEENLISEKYDSYDLVFLTLDKEDEYEGDTVMTPSHDYARVRFNGSHGRAPEYYEKLLLFIKENNFEVCGSSREVTLIDNCITNDEKKFITEISIPITDKK